MVVVPSELFCPFGANIGKELFIGFQKAHYSSHCVAMRGDDFYHKYADRIFLLLFDGSTFGVESDEARKLGWLANQNVLNYA
jgi:hypothetical protein